jgi:hypothetical protein
MLKIIGQKLNSNIRVSKSCILILFIKKRFPSTLKLAAEHSSEALVNIYQIYQAIKCHVLEDGNFCRYRNVSDNNCSISILLGQICCTMMLHCMHRWLYCVHGENCRECALTGWITHSIQWVSREFLLRIKQLQNEADLTSFKVLALRMHGFIPALHHTSSGMVFN